MKATIRQCVIALGDGGAAWQRVGDRPFIAWLLRELLRFGVEEAVLLADGAPERPIAPLPRPLALAWVHAAPAAGSLGALHQARARLDERFLLCRGDALLDANLAPLLAAGGTSAAHDIAALPRAALDAAPPAGNLADLFSALAGRLAPCELGGWRVDLAAPGGLALARSALPRRLHRPALLLDRDGTLNIDHGYVGSIARFDWIAGAREAVRRATDLGWHVFVATNQSGIARGLYDEAALDALHRWMADELRAAGGTLDDLRYCPYHPDAPLPQWRRASDWRKPAPGMLLDLMRCWELDPSRCLMIGDQPGDMQAAAAAGVEGRLFRGNNLAEFLGPLLERKQGSGAFL